MLIILLLQVSPSNATIGNEVLMVHGLNYSDSFYWISVGALIGFWLIFNIGFTFSLSYSKRKFLLATHVREEYERKIVQFF